MTFRSPRPHSPNIILLWNAVFKPHSKEELKGAIDACLDSTEVRDCSRHSCGPIEEWEVSNIHESNPQLYHYHISYFNVNAETPQTVHKIYFLPYWFNQGDAGDGSPTEGPFVVTPKLVQFLCGC